MKKLILSLASMMMLSTSHSQWSFKTISNGFDDPYKIAYTPTNNGAAAYMLFVENAIVLSVDGGYYCEKEPSIDVVLVVNGVDNKFEFDGYKGGSSDVVYITWDMASNAEFLNAFKLSSTMKVRINESYCTTEVYTYKMTNSKAAFEYMIK